MKVLLILDHDTFGGDYINIAKNAAPYCDMIRYRARELSAAQIYENAAALRKALPESVLILSEYADMAQILGYDGVHLRDESLPVDVVKRTFPRLIVGYSAHSAGECELVADYFTLSPVFQTNKLYETIPLGAVSAPAPNVYALGGINTENIDELKGLGYLGVAGISFHSQISEIKKLATL